MLLRRISVENVRSFLDKQELILDEKITIIIGPNGGGKTNLLDTIVIMLKRYLFASGYVVHAPSPDDQNNHNFQYNDHLNNLSLEKHSQGSDRPQNVDIEIEVTDEDIENMHAIKEQGIDPYKDPSMNFSNNPFIVSQNWDIASIKAGDRLSYCLCNGALNQIGKKENDFLEYLKVFDFYNFLRDRQQLKSLRLPMLYLPVNRAANGFQSSVGLSGYNDIDLKRQHDATYSRTGSVIIQLAIGDLAKRYRLLQEKDNINAKEALHSDPNLIELTRILKLLGFDWELATINAMNNHYDIRLRKQGISFLATSASSGEREILTYLFAIFVLNIKNTLIIIDEPELHLHPKWQKILYNLFEELTISTGNQFLIATHSPIFVTPKSIKYVSRIYSHEQKSRIIQLNSGNLPRLKHLFNFVNSQNNEIIFFSDYVILVEGISDRIVFERILDKFGRSRSNNSTIEIISVGGKGLFEAYRSLLTAFQVRHCIIADLDYIEQVGTGDIKALFKLDSREIITDVIDNSNSIDGDSLVKKLNSAIEDEDIGELKIVWEYVKSRRIKMKRNLSPNESQILHEFIEFQKENDTFILPLGSLEMYLPTGYSRKDLNLLIEFMSQSNFWEKLTPTARDFFKQISDEILMKIQHS